METRTRVFVLAGDALGNLRCRWSTIRAGPKKTWQSDGDCWAITNFPWPELHPEKCMCTNDLHQIGYLGHLHWGGTWSPYRKTSWNSWTWTGPRSVVTLCVSIQVVDIKIGAFVRIATCCADRRLLSKVWKYMGVIRRRTGGHWTFERVT